MSPPAPGFNIFLGTTSDGHHASKVFESCDLLKDLICASDVFLVELLSHVCDLLALLLAIYGMKGLLEVARRRPGSCACPNSAERLFFDARVMIGGKGSHKSYCDRFPSIVTPMSKRGNLSVHSVHYYSCVACQNKDTKPPLCSTKYFIATTQLSIPAAPSGPSEFDSSPLIAR